MVLLSLFFAAVLAAGELESARDKQSTAGIQKAIAALEKKPPADAPGLYRLALAYSYLAEVNQELRDKAQAKRAADAGIKLAQQAIALKPDAAEYHRLLGTLYGQVIPANVLAGLSYGKKAQDAINKALALDPKAPTAYLARGVGNYYLPEPFGGGFHKALTDFQKAIELNPKSDEGYLWIGLAYRKLNRNAEARKAFSRSLELNPNRVWTRQQLDKTPAS